jgi:uncharacterized protein (TIGR04255 family)
MERKYNNPPVVEALCEFQFIPNQPWDITIPGLIYEKIKNKFPEKHQQNILGLQFQHTEKGIESKIEHGPPRIEFFKKDKTGLLQVGPDLLIINQLKPYIAWENFKSMIMNNFNIYKKIANPKSFKRIDLRYINIFEFDTQEVKLDDYFMYYPFIPKDLSHMHFHFSTNVELPFKEKKEVLILKLQSIIPNKPNLVSLVLDIDYAMITPEYISLDAINEWLEKAHNKVENAFESIIKDKTRNLFEKDKD